MLQTGTQGLLVSAVAQSHVAPSLTVAVTVAVIGADVVASVVVDISPARSPPPRCRRSQRARRAVCAGPLDASKAGSGAAHPPNEVQFWATMTRP